MGPGHAANAPGKELRRPASRGALIVYDALIDDERRREPLPLLVSLNMLIETPGGSGHTGAECREWMQDAGFKQVRVEHLLGAHGMVVGIKER